MIGIPATFVGLTGTAVLLAGLLPVALGGAPQAGSLPPATSTAAKADRISRPVPGTERATVTSVELVGIANATVILRDRNGSVLFRSDPMTNTTLVSKDADLPVVTLKEEGISPVVQQPIQTRDGNQPPPARERAKSVPGCETPVSPLAGLGRDRPPGLCLVEASPKRVI